MGERLLGSVHGKVSGRLTFSGCGERPERAIAIVRGDLASPTVNVVCEACAAQRVSMALTRDWDDDTTEDSDGE